jgi:hypothetical protein
VAADRWRYFALVFSAPENKPCIRISFEQAFEKPVDEILYRSGALLSLGDPNELEHLLREAGFRETTVVRVAAPFCTPTVAGYIDFLRQAASPLIEILAPLPKVAQEAA